MLVYDTSFYCPLTLGKSVQGPGVGLSNSPFAAGDKVSRTAETTAYKLIRGRGRWGRGGAKLVCALRWPVQHPYVHWDNTYHYSCILRQTTISLPWCRITLGSILKQMAKVGRKIKSFTFTDMQKIYAKSQLFFIRCANIVTRMFQFKCVACSIT